MVATSSTKAWILAATKTGDDDNDNAPKCTHALLQALQPSKKT